MGELSPQVTERESPRQKSRRAAISAPFVRANLSLCVRFLVSILALSVCFADTSPKGRGFHEKGRLCKTRKR